MQAILVKFRGPGNVNGSRFIASAFGGRISYPRDHALDADANALCAAKALRDKLGWKGEFCSGTLPNGHDRVFVFCEAHEDTNLDAVVRSKIMARRAK